MSIAMDSLTVPMYDAGPGSDGGPPPTGGLWSGAAFWSGEGGFVRSSGILRAQSATWSLMTSTTAAGVSPAGFVVRVPSVAGAGEFSIWLLSALTQDSPVAYMVSFSSTGEVALRQMPADTWLVSTTGVTVAAGNHVGLLVDDEGVNVSLSTDGGTTFTSVISSGNTAIAGPFYAGIETDQSGYHFDQMRFGTFGGTPPEPDPVGWVRQAGTLRLASANTAGIRSTGTETGAPAALEVDVDTAGPVSLWLVDDEAPFNGYEARSTADTLSLHRIDAGVSTTLDSTPSAVAGGDVLRLVHSGTRVTASRNDVAVGVDDSAHAGPWYAGLLSADDALVISEVRFGEAEAPPAPAPYPGAQNPLFLFRRRRW